MSARRHWIVQGDCLATLKRIAAGSVQTCITSPPYWGLRDYGHDGQIGLEETPDAYVARLVEVFGEVRRVLRDDGTLWLNLGDSYAANIRAGSNPQGGASARPKIDATQYAARSIPSGLKPKDLVGIPWRVAFALQADGWYLRSDIIWHKPNPMPESVTDRPTKAHEYLFLLTKSERYYYDADAIKEPSKYPDDNRKARQSQADYDGVHSDVGQIRAAIRPGSKTYPTRNRRTVWTITPKPFKGAHFATFPPDLVEPCVLAGSKPDDFVLDPFNGAGTTGLVALRHGRRYVGCELNPEYVAMSEARLATPEAA